MTPEEQATLEIQRIAAVCGEFAMAGCHGIVQYRATFAPWAESGETQPTIVAVQPEKVEGIFEAIWRRLSEQPEYQPVKAAERETSIAINAMGRAQDQLGQANATLRSQGIVIRHLRLMMKDGPEYAGPHLPQMLHLMGLYLPKEPPEPPDDTT